MKCYLISNHTILDEKKINSLEIASENLIVLFNHARPFEISTSIKLHENKILFIRSDWSGSYWGLSGAIKNQNFYRKIILINRNNSTTKTMEEITNFDLIEEQIVSTEYAYLLTKKKKNKSLTSGFIGFLYVRYYLNINNICLVNFTGGSSVDGKPSWHGHDYAFEQLFYTENNICSI